LKKVNERHDFEEQEYEGSEVVLKRDNTDANNPSITSRQQAVITHKDGVWYIEDKSEQKTTFVQASRKVELHDGDLILLGNRLFEFHE
jgi:pSer/pThr/pTyr-binding forkhead associated (FHA) protein